MSCFFPRADQQGFVGKVQPGAQKRKAARAAAFKKDLKFFLQEFYWTTKERSRKTIGAKA